MRTIVVDDEQLARDELSFLIRTFPDVELIAEGADGLEAVELVREHKPDLIFLDVQMPGLDGFAVVERLLQLDVPMPYLVFATAYDQYAVHAFEVNAVDYVLKPFDRARLERTIERVRRAVNSSGSSEQKLDRMLHLLEARQSGFPAKLLIRIQGRNLLVDPSDIVYARIEDGVISVSTTAGEGHGNFRTIEDLQANLDPKIFWRAHRSFVVNLNHVREVVPWFNSSYQLRMNDKKQTEIPVSRNQSRRLRELFNL